KNIKYFGSQSWPFPNSLMMGFTAEYESGEIQPDGTEIVNAGFFSPDEIQNMNIPGKASIARRLIDNFLAGH
ncbi:MAG: NAD(+) diphosphatase, partial [Synergistaceae bacterium]|nr:NAD(+) diphosphatase [Synergistaceae bacterium]